MGRKLCKTCRQICGVFESSNQFLLQLLISTALRHAYASIQCYSKRYGIHCAGLSCKQESTSYLSRPCSSPKSADFVHAALQLSSNTGVESDPCPVIYSYTFARTHSTRTVHTTAPSSSSDALGSTSISKFPVYCDESCLGSISTIRIEQLRVIYFVYIYSLLIQIPYN